MGCHAHCERYKGWAKERQTQREARYRQQQIQWGVTEMIAGRVRKAKRKMRRG